MISALATVALAAEYANTTSSPLLHSPATNNDSRDENFAEDGGGGQEFPGYIRTTSMVFCIFILGIGVIGNVMVPLVILKSRDMRNSTNIFLTNLSIADLMVLLVCTPTVLVEVNSKPETWVLGEEMCKAVPFVELTVAHASVLTILAISFERYYAICEPLKAGYVCTKERALLICFLAWAFAALFTSPVLFIAEYGFFNTSATSAAAGASASALANVTDVPMMNLTDAPSELRAPVLPLVPPAPVPFCQTKGDTLWKQLFFVMTISMFFLLPLALLLVLYAVIARRLMADPGTAVVKGSSAGHRSGGGSCTETSNLRARKQVVLMLGTVVMSFFICLLPFRVLILVVLFVSTETLAKMGYDNYFIVLYFCRTMLYLNSAINPILYNLMSSKFREGFMRLCGLRRRDALFRRRFTRSSTLNTTTTVASMSFSSGRRFHPGVMRSCSGLSLDSRTLIFTNNHSPRGSPAAQSASNGSSLSLGLRRNVLVRSSMGHHHHEARGSFRDQYTVINGSADEVHPESYV